MHNQIMYLCGSREKHCFALLLCGLCGGIEVTKKSSLAAMAGFVATRGRALPIDQISRAYDGKVVSIGRKEPGPERAEPVSATVPGRLV
jgi:hypothetical protein